MEKSSNKKNELIKYPGKPYTNPYLAGALLGVVLFLAFYLTGDGLGASGGLNRIVAFFEDLIVPAHIDRVAYLINLAGGDKNPLDHWIVLLTFGILVGGFLSGLIHKRLKFTTGKGPRISVHTRWALALIGGIIMGYGARLARGCTSGQGINGAATLSVGSWAFLFSVFIGGYALAYFLRKVWN